MHNVVAVAGGTNACWQGSGKSAKRVPSGIDTALKNGASGSVLYLSPQMELGGALPMHSLVAVTGGTNACWQGSGKSAKHVPSGIDTALKNGASGSVLYLSPQMELGGALPMHSLVAVTGGTNACWQGSGKSAKRVPSGIDNVLKNGASCSVFAFITLSCITTGAERPPFCFCRCCLLAT